jgi:peptidylprolyl isomerase
MRTIILASAAALLIGAAPPKKLLTPNDIVAGAPASAWKTIDPDDLLVMNLRNGGRVVVQLAPEFAPVHVANIKALARGNYWDGASIYRVQDNYVAQWGLNESDRPWPKGVTSKPPAEYTRTLKGLAVKPLGYADPYAQGAGFVRGWPNDRARMRLHELGGTPVSDKTNQR